MRVPTIVSASGWRYAVGELLLIVLGVTIALAATSWYEARQEQSNERLILQQLHQTLTEDLAQLQATWEMTRQREQDLTSLLVHLESEASYRVELARYFQSLFGWRTVRLRTAPFEALKIDGYQSISDGVLREKLISFHEDLYAKLEYSTFLDRDIVMRHIQPYFFNNFVMQAPGSSGIDQYWVPIDYGQIRAEGYLANMSRFRADILRRFDLRHYRNAAAAMTEILDLIEQELAEA